ncbi:RND superfamily putative drug exporter [Catenulispora sp. GAS73]
MSALARWCYQHRLVVITVWVALLVGLGVMSGVVKNKTDNSLVLPGTGSNSAQELLQRSGAAQAGDADQIVWQVGPGRSVTEPAVQQRISAMLTQVSHLPEVASVAGPYSAGGEVQLSSDKRTAYATVNFTKQADTLNHDDVKLVISTATAAREPGLAVELGGAAIESVQTPPSSTSSAIGIAAAAVILFVVFGSLLATALPIVTAVAGVGSGMLLVSPLSHVMAVNGVAPVLGALIGLGVGIDYALFILTRHRRGLESGLDPEQSTVEALNSTGRAVLFAGGTVCVALLGLLTIGVGFINGLAVPAAMTVVCTVIASLTLLPALFGVFGLRVLGRRRRRALLAGEQGRAESGQGLWARWAQAVPRFAPVLATVGLAAMLLIASPVLHLKLGFVDASNDATSSTSYKSYEMLADGFGPGFNGPLFLVSEVHSPADQAALDRLNHALATVPGVAAVQAPPAPAPAAAGSAIEVTQVLPKTAPQAQATPDLINHLRDSVVPEYADGTALKVYVGGVTASNDDFAAMTNAKLPLLLVTVVGLSFLLLLVAFRSLLIPTLTAALNLLAAAASFGVLTAYFQWGWGTRLFGQGAASPIMGYMPEIVLAVLFGLSMDYQVFLVSRMAEEWSHTRDNTRAVIAGLTHTARVITAAALIMIAVFAAFSLTSQRDVAEFGVGLAAAVALDAFIVRTVLVPSVMYLCGAANWWLPKWLDRRMPHLAIEPPAGGSGPAPGGVRNLTDSSVNS